VQGVVRCPGLVFATQVGRTIYDLRGAECEDVNHRGELGQSANSRQLSQQRLHRQSLRGTHPRTPAPRDERRRGQRLSATATAYPVARCGDRMTSLPNSRCHHKMRARWLATSRRLRRRYHSSRWRQDRRRSRYGRTGERRSRCR